jgi:DNA-binding response OmpR family regulator
MMRPRHLRIVDDSALIGGALRLLFEAHQYRVSVAHSVASAIGNERMDPSDILLLDLSLSDGDGLEVLAGLRRHNAPVPLTIVLTGHDDDVTRERCRRAGCAQVLLKPVVAQELLAQVRSLETALR